MWTDPWNNSFIDELMCYALSISLVQKFSKDLLVYTDERGAYLLRKYKIYVPYKIIDFDIQYDEYPKFSEAKLKTLTMESDPFCHIDHDVFLFKQQEHQSYCDLVVQNIENGEPWYSNYFGAYNSEALAGVTLPPELITCASNDDYGGYNCGYIDVNNIDVVREWARAGIEISKQYKPASKMENIIPEQFSLYALAKYRNYKVKTLFLDPFEEKSEPVNAGYVHLMNAKEHKYRHTLARLLRRVKEYVPSFYDALSESDIEKTIKKRIRKHKEETREAGFSRSFFLINTQKNPDIKNIYLNQKKIGRVFRTAAGFKTLESLGTLFVDFDFSYNDNGFSKISDDAKEHIITIESLNILTRVKAVAEEHLLNFRVYKTCHGLRLICKNKILNPESLYIKKLYRQLLADPAMDMFAVENFAFPARVQPKPKRLFKDHPIGFSFYSMDTEEQNEWLSRYEEEMRKYKVCEYLHDINGDPENDIVLPDAEKIISIHDKFTRCFSHLPLA